MEVHPYRDPDDEILADFVEVVAQNDGMLVVPPEAKLENVGPRSKTIKPIARRHMELLGLRGPTGARHVRMPIDQPLFPTLPQVTDINQRSLGDCWFLAALAAIVAMGSGWAIKYMMRSVAVDNRKRPRDDPGREATHAVVRLYDERQFDHYLLVQRSLVETDVPGKIYHSSGPPWVAMLEKAMTAIDSAGADHPTRGGHYDPRGANYGRLVSGRSHVAFAALLGVGVEYQQIRPKTYHGADLTEEAQLHLLEILSGESNSRLPAAVMMDLFQGVVPPPRAELFYRRVWAPWVKRVRDAGPPLQNTFYAAVAQSGRAGEKPFRQEDFERLLVGAAAYPHQKQWWDASVIAYANNAYASAQPPPPLPPLPPRLRAAHGAAPGHNVPVPPPMLPPGPFVPPPVVPPPPLPPLRPPAVAAAFVGGPSQAPTLAQAVQCVVGWVRRKRVFAGERGSGLYTLEQEELYREIQGHLRNCRPVCLGTSSFRGIQGPGSGNAGEHLSKGLAGPHAYAVLDCREGPGGTKYVQVYNPWGRTGRGYTFAPDFLRPPRSTAAELRWVERSTDPQIPPHRQMEHAYQTDAGEFYLELSDVTKRCNSLYACLQTPPVIVQGRLQAGQPIPE